MRTETSRAFVSYASRGPNGRGNWSYRPDAWEDEYERCTAVFCVSWLLDVTGKVCLFCTDTESAECFNHELQFTLKHGSWLPRGRSGHEVMPKYSPTAVGEYLVPLRHVPPVREHKVNDHHIQFSCKHLVRVVITRACMNLHWETNCHSPTFLYDYWWAWGACPPYLRSVQNMIAFTQCAPHSYSASLVHAEMHVTAFGGLVSREQYILFLVKMTDFHNSALDRSDKSKRYRILLKVHALLQEFCQHSAAHW